MDVNGPALLDFELKKRRPGCTGMFWRADPTGHGPPLKSNDNWPRDGARLRGRVVTDSGGKKWLLVEELQQAPVSASSAWIRAPRGAAMPFEYDNHYYLEQCP
jgi:hypothetical protein